MEEIYNLYITQGNTDYIGESITQIQHACQCAILAEFNGEDEEFVLACFLHDIGHLLKADKMIYNNTNYGTKNHENIGANFLRDKGISEKVCDLVKNHVNAKRYLHTKKKINLSDASKITLCLQGGKMSESEMKKFESNSNFNLYLKLRDYDDKAKIPNFPEDCISYASKFLLKDNKNLI